MIRTGSTYCVKARFGLITGPTWVGGGTAEREIRHSHTKQGENQPIPRFSRSSMMRSRSLSNVLSSKFGSLEPRINASRSLKGASYTNRPRQTLVRQHQEVIVKHESLRKRNTTGFLSHLVPHLPPPDLLRD